MLQPPCTRFTQSDMCSINGFGTILADTYIQICTHVLRTPHRFHALTTAMFRTPDNSVYVRSFSSSTALINPMQKRPQPEIKSSLWCHPCSTPLVMCCCVSERKCCAGSRVVVADRVSTLQKLTAMMWIISTMCSKCC